MSVTPAVRAPLRASKQREHLARPRGDSRPGRSARASAYLFAGAFVIYAVLGYFIVLRWHIIVGDGVSRLAHAYFVFYNHPPKLAAIGFVWPPLMTIVMLPFAAIKPIATSLLGLVLMSATFGAGMVVILDRTFGLLGMSRAKSLPLVALFGINPMLLYYSGNGMGESLSLFLIALSVYAFLRWYLQRTVGALILTSVALTLALVARYEALFSALVLGVVVCATLIRQRVSRDELEGSFITFFAPIAYGLGLWIFFNWLIMGDPLHWLHSEVTQTLVATRVDGAGPADLGYAASISRTLALTWHLFPATWIVVAALGAAFAWRRDLVSLVLVVLVLLNPVTTALLAAGTQSEQPFQLRYNLRALPVVLAALGWLWLIAAGPRARAAVWIVSAVLLAASIPSTWQMMRTYRFQSMEQAFTRALASGSDQEGTRSLGIGVAVGDRPERGAARWIRDHVRELDSVLADDEQAFAVMLLTGRPDLFLDRIDQGDLYWQEALADPAAVRYFLVPRWRTDLIRVRYPTVLAGGVTWLRPVFRNARWEIFRVEPRPRPG